MAAVEVTISGVMYDKLNRTMQSVVLIGEASLTGLSVGGGPIPPGQGGGGGGGGLPDHIWGGGNVPMPTPPIANVPGAPGYNPPGGGGGGQPPSIWPNPPEGIAPHPEHPIVIPPDQCPPGMQPNPPPAPGSPTTPVPPPPGQDGWPVNPVVPPPYLIVTYPGIGPVVVAPPVQPDQQHQ